MRVRHCLWEILLRGRRGIPPPPRLRIQSCQRSPEEESSFDNSEFSTEAEGESADSPEEESPFDNSEFSTEAEGESADSPEEDPPFDNAEFSTEAEGESADRNPSRPSRPKF